MSIALASKCSVKCCDEKSLIGEMAAKLQAPPKRPVRQLSIQEKLEAIQRVHEGESKASVARIIGVPESTLRGWCKNEDKLQAMANKSSPSPEPMCLLDKQDGPSDVKRLKLEADTPKKSEVDESLWFWLRNQQQQPHQPLDTIKTPLDNNSSWFWRWYKSSYGYQSIAEPSVLEPLPLVKGKSTLDTVLLNLNNNNVQDEAKENKGTQSGHVSEDEDDPPETAAEALKHGEKFLRWLECCSDPSVTAVQLLQFRYLLNNVRECAERRANKTKSTPRAKRK